METEQWAEHLHSIWKLLPLHPQPQPLESFTSYLIRLAEANRLQSINELVALVGIPRRRLPNLYSLPDGPAPSYYAGLAQLTGCPEERLLQTTFFPLVQRFGRSTHPYPLHMFLAGSLAPSLRYCPLCLDSYDPPYYSLLWRFLMLPGCTEHRVQFLDQCGHCGSPLPLLSSFARFAKCPTCQGDLRRGPKRSLSDEVLSLAHRHTQGLSMLLSSMHLQPEEVQTKMIGKQCMALRQEQDLSITEIASLSSLDRSVIKDIEQGRRFTRASLDDYIRYVNALSCSLLEVFDTDCWHSLRGTRSEELVFKQVEAAIQQLKRQGEPVTRDNIKDLVGMEITRLRHYPQVDSLLTKCLKEQAYQATLTKDQPEEELVKRVEQAIEHLRAKGSRVSQRRVCDLVGMRREALMVYPRVKAQLQQIAYYGPPHDILIKVQDAVEKAKALGIPLTYRNIGELIDVSTCTVSGNSQAKAIIRRAQNEIRELRENELVKRVENAIEELALQGEKPSFPKVGRIVGMKYGSLYEHAQVRELLLSRR